MSDREVYALKHGATQPLIYGISPLVFPKPAEWGENVTLTGFLSLGDHEKWKPSKGLREFLDSGPAPVYVGFGSMNAYVDKPAIRMVVEAALAAGQRVILATGWDGDSFDDAPPGRSRVFLIGDASHQWLFPRMCALVHHGGAGTTAAAMLSGVPSIIVPFITDQFFWSHYAHDRGVAAQPIPFRRLTRTRVARALRLVLSDGRVRQKAADMGAQLRLEDGVARAVEEVQRFAGETAQRKNF